MALARDQDGENPGADNNGGVRDKLAPERQQAYDDVLAGMESGDDDPSVASKAKAKKSPPAGKAAGAGKRSSAARPASAARAWGSGADDGETDEAAADEDEGIVPGTEDDDGEETQPGKRKPAGRPDRSRAADAEDDDDDDDDQPDEDDDEDTDPDEDDDDEAADSEDDDADPDEGDEDEAEAKTAVQRGLRKLAEKDRRQKQQQAEWRASFEREKAAHWRELEPHVAATKEWLGVKSRAETDKIGAIMEFAEKVAKLDGEGFFAASKQLFLKSPQAAQQPGAAAEAARLRTESETRSKTDSLERKIAEMEERDRLREQDEADRRATRGYLNRVVGAVTGETPLARRLLRRAPEATRERLHELAAEHIKRTGETPSARRLLRTLERKERQLLRDRGIDPDTVVKRKAGADEANKATKKTKGGKTSPPKSRTNGSGAPFDSRGLRSAVLRGLEGLERA